MDAQGDKVSFFGLFRPRQRRFELRNRLHALARRAHSGGMSDKIDFDRAGLSGLVGGFAPAPRGGNARTNC